MFIWQSLDIYLNGGSRPYTRQLVGERLLAISPAWIIWIILAVGGFIVWEVFGVKQKTLPYKDSVYILNRTKKRMPKNIPEDVKGQLDYISREQKIIAALKLALLVICVGMGIYCIVYLATPAHFTKEHITEEVLNMAINVAPCVAVAGICLLGITIYEGYSAKQQLPKVQQIIAQTKAAQKNGTPLSIEVKECPLKGLLSKAKIVLNDKRVILTIRIALAVIAVVFIILGALNGNMRAILIKAINICTECIGLG
jgi:hypothetical protein